jgi:hypothetical protein
MESGPVGENILRLAGYLHNLKRLRIRTKNKKATTIYLVGLGGKQQNSSSPYTVSTPYVYGMRNH